MQGFYFEIGDRKLYKSFRLFIDTLTDFIKKIYIYGLFIQVCLDIYCCCDDYLGLGGDRACTAWMFVCLASRGKERAQQRSGSFALHWKTVQLGHAFTLHSGPTSWWRPWRIHGNTATCRFSVINTGLLEVGSGNLGCLAIRKRRNHRCEKVRFTSGFFPLFSFFLFHLW